MASSIRMNGIDWLKVNASKNLKADTIEIFLDTIIADYTLLQDIELKKNEMIKGVKCDKLIIHLNNGMIKNIPEAGNLKFDGGGLDLDNVDYSFKKKEFLYKNPSLKIKENKLSFNNKPLYIKQLTYANQDLLINDVFYQDKQKQLILDIKEITTAIDIHNLSENLDLNKVIVNANKIKIQDEFDNLIESSNRNFSFKELQFKSKLVEVVSKERKSKVAVLKNMALYTNNVVVTNEKVDHGDYKILANSAVYFDNSYYNVNTGKINITQDKVNLQNLKLKSKKTRAQLAVNRHPQNTIYELEVGDCILDGRLIDTYRDENIISADKAFLANAKLVIYSDMNADVRQKNKLLISQLLKELKVKVDIPLIDIKSSYVRYDLRAERRVDNGSIHISNVEGTINNFTNINSSLEKDFMLRSNFTGVLMDEGILNFSLNFNMIDKQNSYDFKGNLKGLDFQSVNRMLEDLTAVRIKKGKLDELKFEIKANKYRSQGQLEFYYENLKTKYVEERTTGIKDPFRLVLNNFILRQNNRKGRSPKIAKVDIMHEPKHSNFRRMWECIYEGIQITLLPKLPKNPLKRKG